MSTDLLELELKKLIISTLELEDVTPADIISNEPLFNEGLGLDSIDALELGVAIQKQYGVKLSADSEDTKKHFSSITNLALMVANQETIGNSAHG
jgi:acyl carrier protein